jgi:hypothetical protein
VQRAQAPMLVKTLVATWLLGWRKAWIPQNGRLPLWVEVAMGVVSVSVLVVLFTALILRGH